ncbi:MAG: hypothetical protein M2R45_01319 [Verrucomicrobia subdivision 3 bacterium]|nr:hypothetical protein [Limisphaerales bacterium]MCS1415185.1 hypothetical protein [Limisphaerales bacterium]
MTGKLTLMVVQYFHRQESSADSIAKISEQEREVLEGLSRCLRRRPTLGQRE